MNHASIGVLLFLSFPLLASGLVMFSDVVVTLRKIDAETGAEKWSHAFPRNQRPYQCEYYEEGVVVFLRFTDKTERTSDTEIVFLDPSTGRPVTAFDTRQYVMPEHDVRLAASHPGSGPITDNRAEIVLPNKWTSFGIARLPWWNAGPNRIYFFERCRWDLVWTLELPRGVHSLANWQDVLIYRQSLHSRDGPSTDRLYGHYAGQPSATWTFELPADVPTEEIDGFGVPGKFFGRRFVHTIGSDDVFTFGNGHVFTLDPKTGIVRWSFDLGGHRTITGAGTEFPNPGMLEIGSRQGLLLFSSDPGKDGALIYLDQRERSRVTLLRNDLFFGPAPVTVGGSVYCFTQQR